MDIDLLIKNKEDELLKNGNLYPSNLTFDFYMERIQDEAQKLKYDSWYNLQEYDASGLVQLESEREFVDQVYGLILKRRPCVDDYKSVFKSIHVDHMSRVEVIDGILNSNEGKKKNSITIKGLEDERKRIERKRRIKKIPVLGSILVRVRYLLFLPREMEYIDQQINQINLELLDYSLLYENMRNNNDKLERLQRNVANLNYSVTLMKHDNEQIKRSL